ncbi:aldehyde dehydrogenase family protein [Rhizobium leguminosarum]|uniref:aldehyde dehydrogenase family protein n=1 Tax=Rhizobium leguminosarum TaxID=384 RepID=UPI0004B9F519
MRKLAFAGAAVVGEILMFQGANEIMKRCAELGGNGVFIVFHDVSWRMRVKRTVSASLD